MKLVKYYRNEKEVEEFMSLTEREKIKYILEIYEKAETVKNIVGKSSEYERVLFRITHNGFCFFSLSHFGYELDKIGCNSLFEHAEKKGIFKSGFWFERGNKKQRIEFLKEVLCIYF